MSAARFQCLSKELRSLLLTDWLRWKDVSRVDAAMCNTKDRSSWLELLQNECVFGSVDMTHRHPQSIPDRCRWVVVRQIRTKEIIFDQKKITDTEEFNAWLGTCARFVEKVRVVTAFNTSISSALCLCTNVRDLCVSDCDVDDEFWEVMKCMPNLTTLHMSFCNWGESNQVPNNLSLPSLEKLSIWNGYFTPVHAASFFQQLPALHSLQLWYTEPDIFKVISASCHSLVMLDLSLCVLREGDNDQFYDLMKSLKPGLRCLLLPVVEHFTARELNAIAEYHGHSLRCLRFSDGSNATDSSISDLVNNLPNLHTLSLRCCILPLLAEKKITNSAITHLIISHSEKEVHIFDHVLDHCPGVTKLSLGYIPRDEFLVEDLKTFLDCRPLIQTVCVDEERLKKKIRAALTSITVLGGDSFNFFSDQNRWNT